MLSKDVVDIDRVVSVACVVAVGVTTQGERRILGVDCGPSEDESFWTRFLRDLVKRGLKGVRLVVSDAHEGLRNAIAKVLSGVQWQRCRVHFMMGVVLNPPWWPPRSLGSAPRRALALFHDGPGIGCFRYEVPGSPWEAAGLAMA
jgi:Transposase, Mutator family